MKNFVKVKEKKLKKYDLAGNFLYLEKGKFYFADKLYNSIFINTEKYSKKGELKTDINNHLTEFFTACSMVKNKPSFFVLTNDETHEDLVQSLGEQYVEATTKKHVAFLEKSPSIHFSKDAKFFKTWVEKLLEKRTDMFGQNSIFIIIDKPETFDLERLETYLSLSRSRKVYFMLLVYDKKAFETKISPEVAEIIYSNSPIKFTCNNDEIASIEVNNNYISR